MLQKRFVPVRGKSRDDSAAWDAANEFGALFNSWITTLNTPNLPKQIWFDENFSLRLGGIRFTEDAPFQGSTRTRIVLAFHAALMEMSLKLGGGHPRFLVLDTPKQHELHSEDLKAFVIRYLQLATTYTVDLQLVIAATELEFLEGTTDQEIWHPYSSSAGKPRFLGQMLPWFECAYSEVTEDSSDPEPSNSDQQRQTPIATAILPEGDSEFGVLWRHYRYRIVPDKQFVYFSHVRDSLPVILSQPAKNSSNSSQIC